jgi:4-amino-4-deoxy-L-arabinose transferase-like glycosyltransferase
VATALADLSKFSAVFFVPAALFVVLALRWRERQRLLKSWRELAKGLAVAAVAYVLVAWTAYRFEVIPFRTPPGRQFLFLDRWVGQSGAAHAFIYRLLEIPLPLTGMLKGVGELFQHTWDGHIAYLFDRVNQHGWWYFFPVVLAIKLPLAFWTLAGIGLFAAVRERNRRALEYAAAAASIVAVCMPSTLNVGVRYVLAVSLLLAPVAALAVIWLWQRSRPIAAALCLWMAVGSATAHPDYLADFNLLAGRKPERIVADSDIDWGQDLRRATIELRSRGAQEVWLAYSGVAMPRREPGIVYHELPPNLRVRGWVAADVVKLYREGADARGQGKPEPYGWLKSLTPTARVGRSIFLYDLREESKRAAAQRW